MSDIAIKCPECNQSFSASKEGSEPWISCPKCKKQIQMLEKTNPPRRNIPEKKVKPEIESLPEVPFVYFSGISKEISTLKTKIESLEKDLIGPRDYTADLTEPEQEKRIPEENMKAAVSPPPPPPPPPAAEKVVVKNKLKKEASPSFNEIEKLQKHFREVETEKLNLVKALNDRAREIASLQQQVKEFDSLKESLNETEEKNRVLLETERIQYQEKFQEALKKLKDENKQLFQKVEHSVESEKILRKNHDDEKRKLIEKLDRQTATQAHVEDLNKKAVLYEETREQLENELKEKEKLNVAQKEWGLEKEKLLQELQQLSTSLKNFEEKKEEINEVLKQENKKLHLQLNQHKETAETKLKEYEKIIFSLREEKQKWDQQKEEPLPKIEKPRARLPLQEIETVPSKISHSKKETRVTKRPKKREFSHEPLSEPDAIFLPPSSWTRFIPYSLLALSVMGGVWGYFNQVKINEYLKETQLNNVVASLQDSLEKEGIVSSKETPPSEKLGSPILVDGVEMRISNPRVKSIDLSNLQGRKKRSLAKYLVLDVHLKNISNEPLYLKFLWDNNTLLYMDREAKEKLISKPLYPERIPSSDRVVNAVKSGLIASGKETSGILVFNAPAPDANAFSLISDPGIWKHNDVGEPVVVSDKVIVMDFTPEDIVGLK